MKEMKEGKYQVLLCERCELHYNSVHSFIVNFLQTNESAETGHALQDDQSFLIRAECLPPTSFPLSCSLSITSEGMAFLYC